MEARSDTGTATGNAVVTLDEIDIRRDVVDRLLELGIPCYVTGSEAMALHGIAYRQTNDTDFVLRIEPVDFEIAAPSRLRARLSRDTAGPAPATMACQRDPRAIRREGRLHRSRTRRLGERSIRAAATAGRSLARPGIGRHARGSPSGEARAGRGRSRWSPGPRCPSDRDGADRTRSRVCSTSRRRAWHRRHCRGGSGRCLRRPGDRDLLTRPALEPPRVRAARLAYRRWVTIQRLWAVMDRLGLVDEGDRVRFVCRAMWPSLSGRGRRSARGSGQHTRSPSGVASSGDLRARRKRSDVARRSSGGRPRLPSQRPSRPSARRPVTAG